MKPIFEEELIVNISTRIIVNEKSLASAKIYLQEYSKNNCLIIVDQYLKKKKNKLDYIKKSLSFFKKKFYYYNNIYEPTFKNLKDIKNSLHSNKFNLIVGIGGGSTMDIAKGLAVVINYNKEINTLQGMNKFNFFPLPVICVPSIFGSGAEITPSAVFINEKNNIKGGINSQKVTPKIALLDPFLASSKDLKQHAICAFDSLVHSIESYPSRISNTFTKKMSIIGSEYTLKGLINLKKFPKLSFKYLALGSIYSIISLMHSEQSIAGAASYPMAVFFNKKHAHCGLSFLDNSIKVMNKKKKNLWDDLLQNLYHHKLIDKNTINSLIDKLKYLRKDFEIDKIIFNREEKAFLTNQILQMKVLNLSPIKFTRSDIKNFLDN